jgi:hypothetical protein
MVHRRWRPPQGLPHSRTPVSSRPAPKWPRVPSRLLPPSAHQLLPGPVRPGSNPKCAVPLRRTPSTKRRNKRRHKLRNTRLRRSTPSANRRGAKHRTPNADRWGHRLRANATTQIPGRAGAPSVEPVAASALNLIRFSDAAKMCDRFAVHPQRRRAFPESGGTSSGRREELVRRGATSRRSCGRQPVRSR